MAMANQAIFPVANAILPPPQTPNAAATHHDNPNLFARHLNQQFPSLRLRERSHHESPASRAQNSQELCYDRIKERYYMDRPSLIRAIDKFKLDVSHNNILANVTTLLNYLPKLSSPVRPLQQTPISNFSQQMTTSHRIQRETTPEVDDDKFETPPVSPSPSAARHAISGVSRGSRKRTSSAHEEVTPPKFPGLASRSRYDTLARRPIELLSFGSSAQATVANTSFGSTVRSYDGANDEEDISFETNITAPGTQGKELDPLSSSFMSTQTQRDISFDHGPPTSRRLFDTMVSGSTKKPRMTPPKPGATTESPRKSFPPGSDPVERHQVKNFPAHGLSAPIYDISSKVPFALRWEATRVALASGTKAKDMLDHLDSDSIADYETVYASFASRAGPSGVRGFRRSSKRTWKEAMEGKYSNINFKASLTIALTNGALKGDKLFNLVLEPLEYELQSCRFQRAYGNDRILYVDIPDPDSLPGVPGQQHHIMERLIEWLHPSRAKRLCGREYRVISLDQPKLSKKKKKTENPGYRAVLFATDGDDIQSVSVPQLIDWYIDLENPATRKQSYRKVFSRLGLGDYFIVR